MSNGTLIRAIPYYSSKHPNHRKTLYIETPCTSKHPVHRNTLYIGISCTLKLPDRY